MNKQLKHQLVYLCFIVFIFSCQTNHMINYRYADGSGNVYLIKNDSIRYEPVKPEYSSSGHYSGGEPAKAMLTSSQKKELETKIEKVFRNTDKVIEQRIKTSGQLMVYEGEKQKEKIIVQRSDELNAFEGWLKEILGQ